MLERLRLLGLFLVCFSAACVAQPDDGEHVATRSDAIIAGSESTTDQDSVVLTYRPNNNQTCTATMVAPNLLVTARHCVSDLAKDGHVVDSAPSDIRVYVGRNALTSLSRDENRPTTVGKQIIVESSTSMYPDIAFVVLEKSLSTPVATMRLDPGVTVGESIDVIGYGIDESGNRPVRRMQRTGLSVYAVGPGRSHIGEPLARGEIVFGEAACSGDSGGPAFSTTTGELVAIASRVGNGVTPKEDEPAAFCVGSKADDVYTDFTPARALADRAFAIASGRELTSAPIVGSNGEALDSERPTDAAATDGGGCTMAGKPASPSMTHVGLLGVVAVLLFSSRRRAPK